MANRLLTRHAGCLAALLCFNCGGDDDAAGEPPLDPFDVPVETEAPPASNDVVFTPQGGGFVNATSVALSTPAGAYEIHYTTDGTVPTRDSQLYSGPIQLAETTLIRALSVSSDGTMFGPVMAQTFVALNPEAASFSSNLPIVLIERHGDDPIDEESNDLRGSSVLTFEPGNGGRATLLGPAALSTRAGVRVRGQSSRGFPQKSYAVELWHAGVDDDRDAVWLGMPADSDWTLIGPSLMDRSLMRSMLAMDLSRAIGAYAPRTRFVEAFLVDREGANQLSLDDYIGVYAATERIKRGQNRVNIAKLEATDTTPELVTGGYMFRIDHEANDFEVGGNTFGWVYPDSEEMGQQERAPQREYLRGELEEFFDALRSDTFRNDLGRHYSEYIDRALFIDHNLINALLKNVDGLRLSAYFYKDRGGPIVAGPVWDFDRSAGTPHDDRAASATEWARGDGTNPLTELYWSDLFADPEFASAYWARWSQLTAGEFSVASLIARIDGYDAQLAEARVRHFERWQDLPPVDGPEGEVEILRQFLRDRVPWMDSQRP